MKKLLIFIILAILLIGFWTMVFSSAQTFGAELTYDNFTGSGLDLSRWDRGGSCGVGANCNATGGLLNVSWVKTLTSVADYNLIRTVTTNQPIRSQVSFRIDSFIQTVNDNGPNPNTNLIQIKMGDTVIVDRDIDFDGGCPAGAATFDDLTTGTYNLILNDTTGEFDLFDDGSFVRSIEITGTNNFTVISRVVKCGGSGSFNEYNNQIVIDFLNQGFESDPEVILVAPTNGEGVPTLEVPFTTNISSVHTVLANATINIFNSTDNLINQTTQVISGTNNNTNFNVTLPFGSYTWFVNACGTNSTGTFCTDSENRTFTAGLSINSESFVTPTTEGNVDEFSLNVTSTSGFEIIQANLIYNGTSETGVITNTGGSNFIITRSRSAPVVTTNTNFTFFWELIFSSGASFNNTVSTQLVQNIDVDDCSAETLLILNYTMFDEETQATISAGEMIELDVLISPLGSTTPIITFSQNYSSDNALVCLNAGALSSASYRMDVQATYSATNHATEFHHIQNFTLEGSTIPQTISLFDLLLNDSTEFTITFKDSSFLVIQDALIDITRKYVSEGVFKSVEVLKTDGDGKAVGHFDTDGVIYTIQVTKNGIVLGTFDEVVVVCQNPDITNCEINLNAFTTGTEPVVPQNAGGINYGLVFNKATRTITLTFTTTDGSSRTVLLNGTLFDALGTTQVCSDILTSSSGTLTCIVPTSVGNGSVQATVVVNGNIITRSVYSLTESASEIFGGNGAFMIMMMYITLPMMFMSSPVGVILGAMMSIAAAIMLNLSDTASVVAVGSTLGWFITAGMILLWRITKGGKGIGV